MIPRRARLQSLRGNSHASRSCGKGTASAVPPRSPKMRASAPQGSVRVLAIDRPDPCRVFLERIKMHHPVENNGMKLSTVGVAFRLSGDRSLEAELGIRSQHFLLAALWRGAEIHVLMPLRDAERNALVQVVFREVLGGCIHHARQPVVIATLLIEQRRRMLGIEFECR